jgi:acylphosphatase
MKAVLINIKGDVQGVSFRYWAEKKAKEYGVIGWAKNDHDGGVTIFAQGEEDAVNSLISWSHDGSPIATVENVSVEVADLDNSLKGFGVK